jgi:hypothetical protein
LGAKLVFLSWAWNIAGPDGCYQQLIVHFGKFGQSLTSVGLAEFHQAPCFYLPDALTGDSIRPGNLFESFGLAILKAKSQLNNFPFTRR